MSKQIKMVVQEKDDGFVSRGYHRENRNGGKFLDGIPEDRKTHANVGARSQSMYGTNGKYEISDAQNKSNPL